MSRLQASMSIASVSGGLGFGSGLLGAGRPVLSSSLMGAGLALGWFWDACDPLWGSVDWSRCDPVGYYEDKFRADAKSYRESAEELSDLSRGSGAVEGVERRVIGTMAGFAWDATTGASTAASCLKLLDEFDSQGMGECSTEGLEMIFDAAMNSAGLGVVYMPVWDTFKNTFEWVSEQLTTAAMAISCSCVPPGLLEGELEDLLDD